MNGKGTAGGDRYGGADGPSCCGFLRFLFWVLVALAAFGALALSVLAYDRTRDPALTAEALNEVVGGLTAGGDTTQKQGNDSAPVVTILAMQDGVLRAARAEDIGAMTLTHLASREFAAMDMGSQSRTPTVFLGLQDGEVRIASDDAIGADCWDLNNDGICKVVVGNDSDPTNEDLNGDGECSTLDCKVALRYALEEPEPVPGPQGERGPRGYNGTDGVDGKDGINGTNGVDGKDGVNGTNGVDGNDGRNGTDGIDGVDGRNGTDGVDGKDGINGTNGVDGKDGRNGTDGIDGVDGRNGTDGVDGKDGRNGTDGVDGEPGPPGEPYVPPPEIDFNVIRAGNGNATHPSLSFTSGATTGLYSTSPTSLDFTTNGQRQFQMYHERLLPTQPSTHFGSNTFPLYQIWSYRYAATGGDASYPGYRFPTPGDQSGMYLRGDNVSVGLSVSGSERLYVDPSRTNLRSPTDVIASLVATHTTTGRFTVSDTRGESGYIGRASTVSLSFSIYAHNDLELRVKNHTHGNVVVTGTTRPGDDGLYDLGTSTHKWRDAHYSGKVQVGAGSIAAPSLTFDSAAATGIYRDGSAGLGMTVNGERRVQLTAYETKLYGVGPLLRMYASTNSSWMDFHGTHDGTVTRNGYIGRSSNDNKIFHVYSDDELRLSGSAVSFAGNLMPTSASQDMGTATNRWYKIYCYMADETVSDQRLKVEVNETGVEPLGLSFVETLRPRTYYYKNISQVIANETAPALVDGINEGFFAHEVKESLDAFNATDRVLFTDSDPSDPKSFQTLSYIDFIPILVRTAQDLAAQVRALEARVAVCESYHPA